MKKIAAYDGWASAVAIYKRRISEEAALQTLQVLTAAIGQCRLDIILAATLDRQKTIGNFIDSMEE